MDSAAATPPTDVSPASEPQRRGRPRKQVSRTPRFGDLGAMPVDDPLAMNAWVHRALGVSAAQVVTDPALNDSQRRKELCDIAARMAALTPQSRVHVAEQLVLGEQSAMSDGAGPAMETVDASPVGAERSTGGGAEARRGRPRKRSLR